MAKITTTSAHTGSIVLGRTGYAFCALALSVGLREIADTEVRSIHSNQMRFGSFQDHWEYRHTIRIPVVSFNGNDLSIEYLIKENLEGWDITVK